jgi:hypothetical protein
MSQKRFKVGDLVEYNFHKRISGIGIIVAVHDVTDAIYDTKQRLYYEIFSQTEEKMPIIEGCHLKKIK